MKAFLWTMLVLYALAIVGNLARLIAGIKPRTRRDVAIDTVVYVAFVAWVSVLLFG